MASINRLLLIAGISLIGLDSAQAMEKVGVLWQLHSDSFIGRDVDAFQSLFESQGIRTSTPLRPDAQLTNFAEAVDAALASARSREGTELFVHLGSHGCVGSVSCSTGEDLPHRKLLTILAERIQQYELRTGKKTIANILCDMCHSGSWKDALREVSSQKSFQYNLLTSSASEELSYGTHFRAQVQRAIAYLNELGPDAAKFCADCTHFEKIAKLMGNLHFSDVMTPQVLSNRHDLNLLSDEELRILLKHSDARLFDRIFALNKQRFPSKSPSDLASLKNDLDALARDGRPEIRAKAAFYRAQLDSDPHRMLRSMLASGFTAGFTPPPFDGEAAIIDQNAFKRSKNKSRLLDPQANLEKARESVRSMFRAQPGNYDLLDPNPQTLEFFSGDIDRWVRSVHAHDPEKLDRLIQAIETHFRETASIPEMTRTLTALRRVGSLTLPNGLEIDEWVKVKDQALFQNHFPEFARMYEARLNSQLADNDIGPIYNTFMDYLRMVETAPDQKQNNLQIHVQSVARTIAEHLMKKKDYSDLALDIVEKFVSIRGEANLSAETLQYLQSVPKEKLNTFHMRALAINERFDSLRQRFKADPEMMRQLYESVDRILQDPRYYQAQYLDELIESYLDITQLRWNTPWQTDLDYQKMMEKFRNNEYPEFTRELLTRIKFASPGFLESHPHALEYLLNLKTKSPEVLEYLRELRSTPGLSNSLRSRLDAVLPPGENAKSAPSPSLNASGSEACMKKFKWLFWKQP